MGIHTAVVIRRSDLTRIYTDTDFGEKLWCAGQGNIFAHQGFEWLGDVYSSSSLPIFHYDGDIWSPRVKTIQEKKERYQDQPPEQFWILDIDGDFAHLFAKEKGVSKYIIDAINPSKTAHEGQPLCVARYGEAITIINSFSSDDIGISVIEGNTSWIVGKGATPSWARASKQNHDRTREVLELTLALRKNVPVNLTEKKLQDLARYF